MAIRSNSARNGNVTVTRRGFRSAGSDIQPLGGVGGAPAPTGGTQVTIPGGVATVGRELLDVAKGAVSTFAGVVGADAWRNRGSQG